MPFFASCGAVVPGWLMQPTASQLVAKSFGEQRRERHSAASRQAL